MEILQEQLKSFLIIAQKLKIAGLVFNDDEQILNYTKEAKQQKSSQVVENHPNQSGNKQDKKS